MAAVHLVWLSHFRRGLPIDTDEAGYFGFALDDLRAWNERGLYGYFENSTRTTFAPLVPLTAAPVLGVFGHTPLVAMSVQLVFLAVLGFAAYALVSTVHGRGAGAIAAAVAMLIPGILDFTRTFHFVVASAAFLLLATAALARSERLEHRGWVAVFGLATGLMLMSRTVMIAFLPGLGLGVLALLWYGGRAGLARRMWNLAVGVVVGLAVTAWWYIPNLGGVVDYLTGLGYDSSYTVGFPDSPFDPDYWTARAEQIARLGLYLVPTLVLLAGAVWWLVLRVRRRDHAPRAAGAPRWLAMLASPMGLTTLAFVGGYVVLSTSPNPGTGFAVPLAPLAVVLGLHAVLSLPSGPRTALTAVLLVSVGLVALGKTTVSGLGPLTSRRCLDLPVLDCVTVADGRGTIQVHQARLGLDLSDPDAARRGEAGAWARIGERFATYLHDDEGLATAPAVVFFASRDPRFNTNSVSLGYRVLYGRPLPMGQLESVPGGDRVGNYVRKMALPQYGQPRYLFTTEPSAREFTPYVSQRRAIRAAECLGFERVRSFRLPDGRTTVLYERLEPLPNPVTPEVLDDLLATC